GSPVWTWPFDVGQGQQEAGERGRASSVGRPHARTRPDPPQVRDPLLVDLLAVRRRQPLGLVAECDLELSVVFIGRGADCLEQRPHLAPLDVAARRMAEDLLDRGGVVVAEVSHGYPSTDSTRGPQPLWSESRLAPANAPSVALLH